MFIDVFTEAFNRNKTNQAIIWNDEIFTYEYLINKIKYYQNFLKDKIFSGMVVSIDSTFTPNTVALFFALIELGCIILPIYKTNPSLKKIFYKICKVQIECFFKDEKLFYKKINNVSENKIYKILREKRHPGIILFSSGSSGEPKAAVHDILLLFEKFKIKRPTYRTINFLVFDHWGGLNTLFHILSNQGTLIFTDDRSSEKICSLIEKYNIELLPTSPTFLNLLMISESYKKYDLSSLKIISYGSEKMPEIILKKFTKIFPHVKMQQTYGLIEVGVLRTKSENNGSLWLKMGGEGIQTRVVDGVLQIKSVSTMLGYLNSKSSFTSDGWFITQDRVETKGEYFRILGRNSDIINVGGEKVHPSEVEEVIYGMDEVYEVIVYGQPNPILGNIVCAKIKLKNNELDIVNFKKKLKSICNKKLKKFMIPVKISIENKEQFNYRYKKIKKF